MRIGVRQHDAFLPMRRASITCGRMPCTGRTVPSRANSPMMHQRSVNKLLRRSGNHSQGNGKIETGALFLQIRGSQIHHENPLLERQPAVLNGRVHALPALLDGRIRQTHDKGAFFRHGAKSTSTSTSTPSTPRTVEEYNRVIMPVS